MRAFHVPRPVVPISLLLWLSVTLFFDHAGAATLVAHYDPAYDVSDSCSSWSIPVACADLSPTIPADGEPHRVLLLMAWPDSVGAPGACTALAFGVGDYASAIEVTAMRPCPRGLQRYLEIPNPGWPAPGTGTGVVFRPDPASTVSEHLQPVYWLAVSAKEPGTLPLGPHPTQGGTWVMSGSNELRAISGFPTIGIGRTGTNNCPSGLEEAVPDEPRSNRATVALKHFLSPDPQAERVADSLVADVGTLFVFSGRGHIVAAAAPESSAFLLSSTPLRRVGTFYCAGYPWAGVKEGRDIPLLGREEFACAGSTTGQAAQPLSALIVRGAADDSARIVAAHPRFPFAIRLSTSHASRGAKR